MRDIYIKPFIRYNYFSVSHSRTFCNNMSSTPFMDNASANLNYKKKIKYFVCNRKVNYFTLTLIALCIEYAPERYKNPISIIVIKYFPNIFLPNKLATY